MLAQSLLQEEVATLEEVVTLVVVATLQLLHPVEVVHQLPLTGLLKVKSLQFKTKNNAVAAGHSLPLETSHPEELSTTTSIQLIIPSNNSLIALNKTTDAMVVLWTLLSNTLWLLHSRLQLTIHILPKMVTAATLNPKELDPLLDTPTFNTTVFLPSKLLLIPDQSPLPSMHLKLLSNLTPVESLLLAAVPHLITESWPSAMVRTLKRELNTPLSRINGVLAGEIMVTSRLVSFPPTLAVCFLFHLSSPSIDRLELII